MYEGRGAEREACDALTGTEVVAEVLRRLEGVESIAQVLGVSFEERNGILSVIIAFCM